ncbi:kinase-like protein [Hypomontagnella monticulosa]|nr:kinase-like protein [Hypomontagnella monticulosa]
MPAEDTSGSMATTSGTSSQKSEISTTDTTSTGVTQYFEYEPLAEFLTGVEDVQKYNEGGHHPVVLDDVLDGRFMVVHKLGSGGFGTVWLCRELSSEKWRAVKVMAASHSSGGSEQNIFRYLRSHCSAEELEENHITMPLEEFWIQGPNGCHRCLVMPVLGCSVADWRMLQVDYEEQTGIDTKKVCRQIIKSMRFLHSHGICHGDLKPANILMKVEGIDDLDLDQIMELMGEPDCYLTEPYPGHDPGDRAPEYLIAPADPTWSETLVTGSIAIIDFGESFFIGNPPESTGIPNLYAAPEILIRGAYTPGLYSDIWSLACTLFEVRTGESLFGCMVGNNDLYITLTKIEYYIGLLPPLYSELLSGLRRRRRGSPSPNAEPIARVGSSMSFSSSELQALATRLDKLTEMRNEFVEGSGYSDVFEATLGMEQTRYRDVRGPNPEPMKFRLARKEVIELSDLLRRMLRYDPAERLNIDAVMSHPWIATTKREHRAIMSFMPMIRFLARHTCCNSTLGSYLAYDLVKPRDIKY